ncbi:uncharacterized protein LOC17896988 [Capsella rubella]|uniref:uncharacterized protein LOC17896988 n=1 Tax=Capsella rubella TaxID=81985 RepID=UPI000CD50019|nr:uncharacterized protein LOC17896988 [Capsella rubella]
MVIDIEDEIRAEKNHPPIDEDAIALLSSPYSLGETEEIGSVNEKLIEICNAHCDGGDNDFNSAKNFFYYDRNFGNDEICRSFELSNELACIVCDLLDGSVVPCSGNDCPFAIHRKCAELDCEDPASAYCPYCWLKYQATRSTAVAAAKARTSALVRNGDIATTRENIQLENGPDKSLPMQLHENIHQIRKVTDQLKALNFQLDESVDQLNDTEKACGEASVVVNDQFIDIETSRNEASVVVNDQPKRVLWTAKEEDMLRVGVEIFSTKIKKNMPWKKILEMGKGVFHKTRNPSDLKDKWRNMLHM